jgi:hypothetical protein
MHQVSAPVVAESRGFQLPLSAFKSWAYDELNHARPAPQALDGPRSPGKSHRPQRCTEAQKQHIGPFFRNFVGFPIFVGYTPQKGKT